MCRSASRPLRLYGARIVLMGGAAMSAVRNPTTTDRRQADEALDILGVAHVAGRLVTTLSGGERQSC